VSSCVELRVAASRRQSLLALYRPPPRAHRDRSNEYTHRARAALSPRVERVVPRDATVDRVIANQTQRIHLASSLRRLCVASVSVTPARDDARPLARHRRLALALEPMERAGGVGMTSGPPTSAVP
jgi:hypothetical protein